jgi:hypothetical protein
MRLGQKQELFSHLLARCIVQAEDWGYKVRMGEVHRPKWVALVNEEFGRGVARSTHIYKLAADLLLFKDGEYLTQTRQYKRLGEWWEAQHELCRWGGRFRDGNHFSLEHLGVK